MQHLLARAVWDTDGVGADLRAYVVDHLADPDAVLVIDKTGDVTKGTHTVGVQRGVHRHRRADRELPDRGVSGLCRPGRAHLHRSGAVSAEGLDRGSGTVCGGRHRPRRGFQTKPELALAMLSRALDAGVPAGWIAGDE